jgi:hypothetical protein
MVEPPAFANAVLTDFPAIRPATSAAASPCNPSVKVVDEPHRDVYALTSPSGAVGPLDAECDRDGVAVVADVEAVELGAPLVGCVLDGLATHTISVEQAFDDV